MLQRKLFCLALIIMTLFGVSAQKTLSQSIAIQWNDRPFEENDTLYPHFTGAVYSDAFGKIPLFQQIFSDTLFGQKATIEISNAVFIPLMNESLLTDFEKDLITDSLQWTTTVFRERNQTSVLLQVMPYRRNAVSGLLEQLFYADAKVAFSADADYIAKAAQRVSQYPEKSIFAEGDWYQLNVSSSGIYKVTGADLKNAGMDISSMPAQQLKLYGNGGSMIPEDNSQQQYLSLQENAILVVGEEDGVFNESDYVLFYGESPNVWKYNAATDAFSHQINYYTQQNHYFIGFSAGSGKRISLMDNQTQTENYTTNESDYYLFHEEELTNLSNGGKIWMGEAFNSIDNTKSFSVSIPNIITSEPVDLRTALASSFTSSTVFKVVVNNSTVQTVSIASETASSTSKYKITQSAFSIASSAFTLQFLYPNGSGANGWLDYYEISARRHLSFIGGQMAFRDKKSVAAGRITKFSISNASNALSVWNITDLTNVSKMAISVNNSVASFTIPTDEMQQFVAFDGTSYLSPTIQGRIGNQNLTGLRNVQSVIVSHPDFLDLAQTLATFHIQEYGLNTVVVTPQQIYNEFSSGKQDVGAIRDFMRMLYKTAAQNQEPQFLLFYGNGSYDYKNILEKNNNFIPTWSSGRTPSSGVSGVDSEYSTDDFFGFLDDDEGGMSSNGNYIVGVIDLGIGRFPVRSRADAEVALDKRLHYSSNSAVTKGAWRNIVCLVTDDQRSFVYDAEATASSIESINPTILMDKIYTDAYQEQHAAGGTRYPDAKNALTNRINNGALIVEYIGHGSIYGWAEERILEVSDAQTYTNYDHLAFMLTATCSFSRFDDPDKISGGEYLFTNPNGGSVGLFTTVRETSSSGNQYLCEFFLSHILQQGNSAVSIGSACHYAKRQYAIVFSNISQNNQQYFTLFGDPAMPLAQPNNNVKCTAVNHISVDAATDTIKALSEVTISGEIQNADGQRIEDFQGKVYAKIFDKEAHLKTLMNDPQYGGIIDFYLWKNMIFNGSGKVENGSFEITFFVPKDIDYSYDYGKISFYAYDTENFRDATGAFNELFVGGMNPNAEADENPPTLHVYMNDRNFVSGGITNQNPVLLVDLYDLHSINVTGASIGHDMVAILDNDVSAPIVLNNYYETEEDYTKGIVQYPFYDLAEGLHTLKVRAWDSYNNSAEQEIAFRVINTSESEVENLFAYPNPMSYYTNFVFDHNHAGETLEITIQIFDLSGRLVTQIVKNVNSAGFRTEPIVWDGTVNGAIVENGMYLYRANIQFPDKSIVQKSNKLIILR